MQSNSTQTSQLWTDSSDEMNYEHIIIMWTQSYIQRITFQIIIIIKSD